MGSDLPEWKLFLWLEQKKSNWDFVENWILLQLEAGSVCLCRTPSGRPFWLHMCLSIQWNRALKASRNTHTLPQTIQGHRHFPIFPQKNLPCWEAQPQQQRLLCPGHPALLGREEQIPVPLSGSIWGAGFSSGCRTRFLMQQKDFWIIVLLVLFRPESAGSSSQTSCIQPQQCKGILRGYNLFLKQE